jgi:hypothetical protein
MSAGAQIKGQENGHLDNHIDKNSYIKTQLKLMGRNDDDYKDQQTPKTTSSPN